MFRNDFRTSISTLRLIAARVRQDCPKELVYICTQLAEMAESAADQNHSLDMADMAAQIRRSCILYSLGLALSADRGGQTFR